MAHHRLRDHLTPVLGFVVTVAVVAVVEVAAVAGSFATADKWPASPSDILAVESVFIGDIVVTTVDGCVWVDPPEES